MRVLLLLLLIAAPASAQSVAPSFTTGSMTQTVTATQTVNETIAIERLGGKLETWTGDNVKAVDANGAVTAIRGTNTSFQVVDAGLPWHLETLTRDAGVIETEDITRVIQTNTVTNTLSVFSQ